MSADITNHPDNVFQQPCEKQQGFVHVYTGDGKGKTTAAIGLAVRAAGAGFRVFFAQFVKGAPYSEHRALAQLSPLITVRQYGRRCFISGLPEFDDIEAARQGLREIRTILSDPRFRLVILDEACIALHFGLFSLSELVEAIDARHNACDVVVTGRYAPAELVARADIVTDMREVRHYYHRGILAREGIDR